MKRDLGQPENLTAADDEEALTTLSLYEAAERGLIDMNTGYFRHPLTGEVMLLALHRLTG